MKALYILLGLIMAGYLFMLGMGAAFVLDELIEISNKQPRVIEQSITPEWYA